MWAVRRFTRFLASRACQHNLQHRKHREASFAIFEPDQARIEINLPLMHQKTTLIHTDDSFTSEVKVLMAKSVVFATIISGATVCVEENIQI